MFNKVGDIDNTLISDIGVRTFNFLESQKALLQIYEDARKLHKKRGNKQFSKTIIEGQNGYTIDALNKLTYNELNNIVQKIISQDIDLSNTYGGLIQNYSEQQCVDLILQLSGNLQKKHKKAYDDTINNATKQSKSANLQRRFKRWNQIYNNYQQEKANDLKQLSKILGTGIKNIDFEQKVKTSMQVLRLNNRIVFNASKKQFESLLIPNQNGTSGIKIKQNDLKYHLMESWNVASYDIGRKGGDDVFKQILQNPHYKFLSNLLKKLNFFTKIKNTDKQLTKLVKCEGATRDPKLLANKINNRLNKYFTDSDYKDKIQTQGKNDIGVFNKIKIQTAEDNFKIIDKAESSTFKLQHDKNILKKFYNSKKLLYKPQRLRELASEFDPPKTLVVQQDKKSKYDL